jgi:hypothetical protein
MPAISRACDFGSAAFHGGDASHVPGKWIVMPSTAAVEVGQGVSLASQTGQVDPFIPGVACLPKKRRFRHLERPFGYIQESIDIIESDISSRLLSFERAQLFDFFANGTIGYRSRLLFHFLFRSENPGTRIRKTVNGQFTLSTSFHFSVLY